jgi:hypothetical protein
MTRCRISYIPCFLKRSDGQRKRRRVGAKQVTGHEGTQLQSKPTHIGLIQWCRAARGHICKLYIYVCVCVCVCVCVRARARVCVCVS